jgi:ATP-dependent Clp protease ATP-binding subunit ClpX
MAKNVLHCSFCGRSRDEVKILIAGQEGHICENCVEHAREIIDQELMVRDEKTPSSFKLTVKKPIEVKNSLMNILLARTKQKRFCR